MSASDDAATPAPDADDEAQPGPAGTAAEGSIPWHKRRQQGKGGGRTDRHPRPPAPRGPRVADAGATDARPAAAPGDARRAAAAAAARREEESILDRLHREQSPTAAAAGGRVHPGPTAPRAVPGGAAPRTGGVDPGPAAPSSRPRPPRRVHSRRLGVSVPARRERRGDGGRERCVGRKVMGRPPALGRVPGRAGPALVGSAATRRRPRCRPKRRGPVAPAAADGTRTRPATSTSTPAPRRRRRRCPGPARDVLHVRPPGRHEVIRFHHEKCAARWPRPRRGRSRRPSRSRAARRSRRTTGRPPRPTRRWRRACPRAAGSCTRRLGSRTVADKLRDHLRECPHRRGHKAGV